MSAETQGAETLTYKPADAASAASLLDLIGELHARIEAGRLIGQGDVAIANGIRAQFTERMLDVALDGVPDPEPPPPELMERMRQARENVVNAATIVAMEDRLAAIERERDEARRALQRIAWESSAPCDGCADEDDQCSHCLAVTALAAVERAS